MGLVFLGIIQFIFRINVYSASGTTSHSVGLYQSQAWNSRHEPGPTTSHYHLQTIGTFYPETFTETYTEYIHFINIIIIIIVMTIIL